MQEKIIILDFGSQTTQLIGRRLRELNVYCEIVPYNKFPHGDESVKGVILSGSPFSVYDEAAFYSGYLLWCPVNFIYQRWPCGTSWYPRVWPCPPQHL